MLKLPDCSFHSLQVDEVSRREIATSGLTERLHNTGRDLADFVGTENVIENLDLVITVDTAVAHPTGTLGKPVWIMLPFAPDWCWLRDHDDSSWHPSARLFRQKTPGD